VACRVHRCYRRGLVSITFPAAGQVGARLKRAGLSSDASLSIPESSRAGHPDHFAMKLLGSAVNLSAREGVSFRDSL